MLKVRQESDIGVREWRAGAHSHRVDQEPVQVVQSTGERVRKTALAILDQLDTLQVGDGTPPGLERDTPSPRTSRTAASAVEADRPRGVPAPALAGRGL